MFSGQDSVSVAEDTILPPALSCVPVPLFALAVALHYRRARSFDSRSRSRTGKKLDAQSRHTDPIRQVRPTCSSTAVVPSTSALERVLPRAVSFACAIFGTCEFSQSCKTHA